METTKLEYVRMNDRLQGPPWCAIKVDLMKVLTYSYPATSLGYMVQNTSMSTPKTGRESTEDSGARERLRECWGGVCGVREREVESLNVAKNGHKESSPIDQIIPHDKSKGPPIEW